MAVRSSMAALIARVRILLNDPAGANQVFADSDIQDVMDEGRTDVVNGVLVAKPTYSGASIQFLDYYAALGDWETDYVLKQYLTTTVTPSAVEPIAGHFQFSATTLPPIYITGKSFDIYRASADLLERQAAKWTLSYNVNVDGQSLQRSQVAMALQNLAKTYRMKQRAISISMMRSDTQSQPVVNGLGATPLDYMSDGSGR